MTENEELENTSATNEEVVSSQETTSVVAENSTESLNAETEKQTATENAVEEMPVKIKAAPGVPPKPDANFDWDSIAKGGNLYKSEEREVLEQKYAKTINSIATFDVVKGTVVLINDREVVVNIGFKSDGLVPASEFRDMPNLKIGDKVDVFVETQEDKNGQLVLSHKRALALRSWDRVHELLASGEVVHGYIKGKTKGGLIVDLFGLEAFLPGSQIDFKPIKDFDVFLGKTMEFKVIKINEDFKNVIVSHKALIEHEMESQRAEIMSKLEKGQIIEGVVKGITSYGAFLDLGGVDGLLHITDMAWGRINHPEEILKVDQTVRVVILEFDHEKKRIALGLKQLTPHPWEVMNPPLKVGDTVKGRVTSIADYGAFMEIAPGIEGLIHVSEMSWSLHLRSASDFLKVGDEVEAAIISINPEERKLSLGMKQLKGNPWANVMERYPVGSKHSAIIRNLTNWGVFVELEEGVDGLIHISDLSWSKRIRHPNEFAKLGDVLNVIVLEVDEANKRLALGVKQLEENPWDIYETVFTVGSVHEGVVAKIIDSGALITLPYGVEGFAPMKHLIKENRMPAKLDEKLEFKVLEFNKDQKRIFVSHSRLVEDKHHAASAKEGEKMSAEDVENAKTVEKIQGSIEKSTMGDISALSDLKNELETSEAATKAKVESNIPAEVPANDEGENHVEGEEKKPSKRGRPKKKVEDGETPVAENSTHAETPSDIPANEELKADDDKPNAE
jgi:small subunit ribosomal protein S1